MGNHFWDVFALTGKRHDKSNCGDSELTTLPSKPDWWACICTQAHTHTYLERLLRVVHAHAAEAVPVLPARGPVGPGEASVAGGALQLTLLTAPQLQADLLGVRAVAKVLPEDLLALAVQAVDVTWGLGWQEERLLRRIQQTVTWRGT